MLSDSKSEAHDGDSISALEVYKWFVAKEKAIFNSLNYMK
jgi:hypothetical protein